MAKAVATEKTEKEITTGIRNTMDLLCAQMNEALARGVFVNFNLGQSAPDTPYNITKLDIFKKL